MKRYQPKILNSIWKINIPRFIIIIFDLFLAIVSLFVSILLRFNFESIPEADKKNIPLNIAFVLIVRFIFELLFSIHKGMLRHSSSRDALRIFYSTLLGTATLFGINFFWLFKYGHFVFPTSVLIIDLLVYIFLMVSARILVKTLYIEYKNPYKNKKYVLIYGAGEAGIITKRTLDKDNAAQYKVIAFIDDDEKKQGKRIENTMVYSPEDLDELVQDKSIDAIIISVQNLSTEKKQAIAEKALGLNLQVLYVPPVSRWINGQLNTHQIKSINIEDLLEREPINLNNPKVKEELHNKIILITGSAGSIGSEIARQCAYYQPKHLILLDIAETPLYELELEMKEKFPNLSFETVIGDIKNKVRMERVFSHFHPDIVFHAAAYKHVPVMEENPSEAIFNNVLGTQIIADLCEKHNVQKMVLISTDKAVNPTNVMGASKRIAEIYVQSKNKVSQSTRYITTRFGNVLGSNGSVIIRFKKQIESGGPVTVTHPDITRFFMTIPEACQLVLEAATMGKGGEIFVFDMGKPVKILDLAKKMIRLSGLKENEDIQIVFTGLRPGEKLYEEVLADSESTIPTHHPKILIGKVREYDFSEVQKEIDQLIAAFDTQDNFLIVQLMKKLVPEFSSNNSVFEQLDKK
ncbi:MAG: polysaccharide biosynthesis protein [Bacteroidia bacterium]|nr:polysaccharide biosynthesis protein [Bacteroidia bacterium]